MAYPIAVPGWERLRSAYTLAMDEPIHPVHLEALKRATPAQKLETVAALYETGIRLRMAGLRMTHPAWTDDQLEFEARRSLRNAGT